MYYYGETNHLSINKQRIWSHILHFLLDRSILNTSYSGKGIIKVWRHRDFCFRCSPPEKSNEYQKIYSNWCHEFEKYKSAMKTWERKQDVCTYSDGFGIYPYNNSWTNMIHCFYSSNARGKTTRIRTRIRMKSCDSFWTSPISCFNRLTTMRDLFPFLTYRLALNTSTFSPEEIQYKVI